MSLIDDLQAVDDKLRDDEHLDLDVPRTGGLILVRYRAPERDKLTPVLAVYRTGGALDERRERQFIIDCHQQVMRRPHPGADPEEYDGGPLRFDAGDDRWPSGVTTARDAVGVLFKLNRYPLAAAGHVEALFDWLQGLDAEIAARVEEAGKAENTVPA